MTENQSPRKATGGDAAQSSDVPPLITCHTPSAGAGKVSPSAPTAAIVCVTEGSVAVRIDDYRERIVRGGELFLLPSIKGYSVHIQDENTRIVVCRFDLRSRLSDCHSLADLMPYRSEESAFHVLQIKPRTKEYLALLESYMMDGIRCPVFHEAKKRELFYHLFAYYPHEQTAALLNPILSHDLEFREEVMRKYLKAKNVVEMARMTNYSTSGFIKRFEKTFGEPPGEWMTRRRMAKVVEELSDLSKPIKQVVEDCGFSSYDHLWDACKRHLGASPQQIRKRF